MPWLVVVPDTKHLLSTQRTTAGISSGSGPRTCIGPLTRRR